MSDIQTKKIQFLQMSPTGYLYNGEAEIPSTAGLHLLQNLKREENNVYTTFHNDKKFLIEAYDYPLVAIDVSPIQDSQPNQWTATGAYGHQWEFDLKQLRLDSWDRFIAFNFNKIPFVFSSQAQDIFFSALDEFTDDTLTYRGQKFSVPDWFIDTKEVESSKHWSSIYQDETPGWELEQASPVITKNLQRLKLIKSHIVVLGCGSGNDAAYLAQQGHIVTAIDFSSEAISQAKEKYAHIDNLSFIQKDVFNLPQSYNKRFDLIIEHTCFCAINPIKREKLVQIWHELLRDNGQLFGVFFVSPQNQGPPFGSTEWEMEKHLKKGFQFLLWERAKNSQGQRQGKELFILAQKRTK